MTTKPAIKVVKDPDNPEPVELLAKSVVQVSNGFRAIMNASPTLSERALVVLLQDLIGAGNISRTQIKLVLENLPRLKAWYVKEKKS